MMWRAVPFIELFFKT